jgi:copper homeostasis protein
VTRRLLLEVIVQSVADAEAAAEGGADRLEVVRALRDGGLTPPLSLVREIAAVTALPLRVMVRENAGYTLAATELEPLRRAAAELAALGVDGLVVGFALHGKPALDDVARVLEEAPGMRATFHRAFDVLDDPLQAIDQLTAFPAVDRILTSGGDGAAPMRAERLREYAARAGTRLQILAGGGVDEEALALFARVGSVREVHVGRAARDAGRAEAAVSVERVRRLRNLAG